MFPFRIGKFFGLSKTFSLPFSSNFGSRTSKKATRVKKGKIAANADTGEKGKAKVKRSFDAHTISIYAENIVERGGNAKEALSLIMNKMEKGALRHSPVLYNTALDICGHKGMLGEAANILQKMVAMNVPPNARSITSLLNAIAERCRGLPYFSSSNIKSTLKSLETTTASNGDENVENTDTDAAVDEKPVPAIDSDSVDKRGIPGVEAFNVTDKKSAADLAIKLYASWVDHCQNDEELAVNPFNALLKVIWRSDRPQLLPTIFPLNNIKDNKWPGWMPEPDIFTFTTAILACRSTKNTEGISLAIRYWDAFLKTGAKVDTYMIMAILMVYQRQLLKLGHANIPFVQKEFLTMVVGKLSNYEPRDITLSTSNTLLDVAIRVEKYDLAISYWEYISSVLKKSGSFVKHKAIFDQSTVALVYQVYLKMGQATQIIPLNDNLTRNYGMFMDTALFNRLLEAHRKVNREDVCKVFEKYMSGVNGRKVLPDEDTIKQVVLSVPSGVERMEYVRKLRERFPDQVRNAAMVYRDIYMVVANLDNAEGEDIKVNSKAIKTVTIKKGNK